MDFELTAKRTSSSKGKPFRASVELNDAEAGTYSIRCAATGDNANLQEQEYADRVHEPGSRGGFLSPTAYEGTIWLDHHEVRWLFSELIKSSDKSDDFKRICLAMVAELSPKPPKRRKTPPR